MLFLFLLFVIARADVQCGTSVCTASTGLFCHGTVCSKSSWTYLLDSVDSGPCTSLQDKTECQLAAGSLGLSDTGATPGMWGTNPTGCVFWNGQLLFNTQSTSVACTNDRKCLCNTPTPACSDGANDAQCQCGTSVCTGTTGLLCDASTSTCSVPNCGITDGSVVNSAACQCGTSLCGPGLFCDNNQCTDEPTCGSRDGSVVNSAACQCGTSVCTEQTGLFCHDTACSNSSKSFPYRTDSGLCQTDNIWLSLNKKGCEQAATSLALIDKIASTVGSTNAPTGCIFRDNSLLFNTYPSSLPCGTNSFDCLCLNFTTTPRCSISDMTSCTDAQLIQIKTSYSKHSC